MSESLAARLAARERRGITVSVEISDPGEDVRTLAVLSRQLLAVARAQHAAGDITDAALADAKARCDAASAALAEHCADIRLVSAPSDVWEAVISEHLDDDGADLTADALPAMLAASAEDESLQDPAWWAEHLPSWPFGDRERLRAAVLDVNAWNPSRALGKG